MRKSKVLGIALAAAMVASIATVSVSAKVTSAGIDGDTVGITGSFCGWGTVNDAPVADVAMTNNNGVWEATIDLPEVTSDMVVEQATMDDGTGGQVARTDVVGTAVTFKIRLNGDWADSWGDYEPAYDRTWNSQTNCAVSATVGQPLKFKVQLDTTKVVTGSSITDPADPDAWNVWPVTYEVVASETPATEDPAQTSTEDPAEDDPSTTGEDTTSTQPAVESDTKDAAPV
ncbi:MAG: hypothetical protein IIT39_03075, partial [Clostridia bacterium]|nr:hypothetical protein [Clostridia bacterium]